MEPEKPAQSQRSDLGNRPVTTPDFLLSRASGSVRTQGIAKTFTSLDDAINAITAKDVEMVVGAVPFDIEEPSALIVPRNIVRTSFPSEPPAFFRLQHVAARIDSFSPTATVHKRRVKDAISAIRDGVAEKIVLARSVFVTGEDVLDPQLIAARLLDGSPRQEAYLADLSPAGPEFADKWLVGSSPELLVSKRGNKVTCHPLAGSIAREQDPHSDALAARTLRNSGKDRSEHRFVTLAIEETLRPLCSELNVPESPSLTSTREMWHLGTHITGTLRDTDFTVLDLVKLLQPTPAVGGWPRRPAMDFIANHEGPRRFYAGTVGWCDANGDGDWVVAIRCAEVDTARNTAQAWAGGGIVADSEPASEIQETRDKLRTMLRALGIVDTPRER
ncbi:MAG TPA: isochorismate synthase [Corynebacteriales bacterium]|nr:isochorismate synthase [Mycobacteriales bacterium]